MHSAIIAILLVAAVIICVEINTLTHKMLKDLEKMEKPSAKDEQSTDKD